MHPTESEERSRSDVASSSLCHFYIQHTYMCEFVLYIYNDREIDNEIQDEHDSCPSDNSEVRPMSFLNIYILVYDLKKEAYIEMIRHVSSASECTSGPMFGLAAKPVPCGVALARK